MSSDPAGEWPIREAATIAAATIAEGLAAAARHLAAAGIPEPRREARLLVALALESDLTQVVGYPERPLPPAARRRLAALALRRAAREPMARILGRREFWSLEFALGPDTLDPRPDSETLVEAALAALPDRRAPWRLLDLGTGTGCLLLALLSELPTAFGIGVDIAPGAVALARRNAAALGLAARAAFFQGSWGEALGGQVDVILANPPYIGSQEIEDLAPEVARHEPRRALDGGPDGLTCYRELAGDIARLLAPAGHAFVEMGADQAPAIAAIMARAGLRILGRRRDLAGVERCVILGRRGEAEPAAAAKKIVGMSDRPV